MTQTLLVWFFLIALGVVVLMDFQIQKQFFCFLRQSVFSYHTMKNYSKRKNQNVQDEGCYYPFIQDDFVKHLLILKILMF
jgi:membrane protein implicated in regulation of membrane protease activity